MEARNIPSLGKSLRGRRTSRYVGNLHVINTSVPNPVVDAPVITRTVTAIPKAFASEFKEQREVKSLAIQRSPKSFSPKGAAISFTKKKVNAAKNFLKQHNKEAFVSTFKTTDSPNLPSKQGKETSSCTVIMPEKVSSYLALQAASMQGVKNKSTVVVKTPEKKRVDIPVLKENSVSSWVPVDTKLKSNQFKDSPFLEKKDVSSKNDSSSLSKVSVGNKKNLDPFEDFLVDKKEKIPARKESQSSTRMSSYFKKERSLHKYSSSTRRFSSREEEERYYEKRYRSSRSSRSRRSRDYERESTRHYKESNPYRWERKNQEPKKSAHEAVEVLDDVSDVPLEEDFEEVETASVEDSTKPSEIPVGFRKYRIRHLKTFKSVGFFKPKRYDVCRERTVVNCLNLEEDQSVEIDIASEVECEADHEAKIDSAAAKDKADSLQHKSTENEKQVADVKDFENNRNGLETGLISNPGDEISKLNFKKNDVVKDASSENLDKIEKLKESHAAIEADNMLPSENLENSQMMDVDALDSAFEIKIKEPRQVVKHSKVYYTCIPDLDSPAFYQGCSLNQKHLDEWQSHLIGLEYLVEIRDKFNKSQVEKYYCGLCEEDIPDLSTTESRVTNHISSYVHGFLYMDASIQI